MGKHDPFLECVFFDRQERREREEARMAAHKEWSARQSEKYPPWDDERRAIERQIYPAGSMWEAHWFFDPLNCDRVHMKLRKRLRKLTEQQWKAKEGKSYLSMYYWRDHSMVRAPLEVICPNGHPWCVDSGSSNGLGWTVTGTAPKITCTPSIGAGFAKEGKRPPYLYHGYLTNGWFCADIDRPDAPRGILSDGRPA